MCFGGNKNASRAAEQAEQQRQARISSTVGNINSAFQGREGQYQQIADTVRESLGKQLARQKTDASRNLKFSLARGGLTGGSVAVDTGKNLADEFNTATLGVEQKAQGASADLRARDEASRLSMIGLAQSGNDVGNAAAQTASMLNANVGAAKADNAVNTLGEVFGGSASTYKRMQENAALRRGIRDADPYAAVSRTGGFGGKP
jgi:hypothetical protein